MTDHESPVTTEEPRSSGPRAFSEKVEQKGPLVYALRIAFALAIPIAAFFLLWVTFDFLRDAEANRFLVMAVAILVGVFGVFALYFGMDTVVNLLPEHVRESVRPFVFVGPALVILSVYLVYPAINTTILSFKDRDGESFVGFDNFQEIFTNSDTLTSIRNSVLWVILVPFFAVAIGLGFAVLVDKLSKRAESISKSMIFMPMAISFVGASIVWRFVYSFRPPGFGEQIGLLNSIWEGLGFEAIDWLRQEPFNNLYLMVILIWLQTGFAMVILSSAIKAVPEDILEAARIDGANEFQVFWRVIFPTIASTMVVVTTTIVITVWKVFDIVFVMTGGQDGTSVVAERMVTEFFTFRNDGVGAALAVVLFLAVIPIMYINVRQFRAQEELR
jgi:alpha-glucoside transport system permease protein